MHISTSLLITMATTTVLSAAAPRCGDDAQSCCSGLETAGLSVLRPSTEAYTARDGGYFSVSAQLKPCCIVQPRDSSEVAKTIDFLREKTTCNFAVRGGGHMTWAGASNIHDGITIDTSLMNEVTYSPSSGRVSIPAGALWRDVYAALEPHGVTAPGGRTSTVGAIGFLLGGGNNFFSSNVGLGCDNVVSFEIVLANGVLINANEKNSPDLFKALKGGSSNFGIVTRADMQTVPVPEGGKFWGGQVVYPLNTTEAHIDAYVRWVDNIPSYTAGSAVTFWAYTPSSGIVVSAALHDTSGTEWAPAYKDFKEIGPKLQETLRQDTHLNFTVELEEPKGYRQIWITLTGANDRHFIKAAVDKQAEFVEKWNLEHETAGGEKPDMLNYITFQAMPRVLFERSEEKGGNVLRMAEATREKGSAILFQMQMMVKTEDEEQDARAQMLEMRRVLKEQNVRDGVNFEWEYLGYADGAQDALGSYGQENVKFLKEVANKVDPEGFFQTRMPGGFKISKVDA